MANKKGTADRVKAEKAMGSDGKFCLVLIAIIIGSITVIGVVESITNTTIDCPPCECVDAGGK